MHNSECKMQNDCAQKFCIQHYAFSIKKLPQELRQFFQANYCAA